MSIRKKLILIFFIILTLFSYAESAIKNSDRLIERKMSNGMTYYIYKNKKPEKRASINVIVKSGSLQEDEDQKGMAHFLEHMCFNGTENYEKNNIIKYFESIGLSFGGDLNAHTSFYETVYKLKLPTDDKEKFEKGVEILYEMTFKALLTQEDLNSEKEIIVEEWRLYQGFRDRLYKNVFQKSIFANSLYEKREVIGDMGIIKSTDRATIKRYYDKWYHPENMAIVLVGDVDEKYAESIIKKYFDKPESRKYIKPQEYSLKELDDNYIIFKDKEIKIPEFQITYRQDRNLIKNDTYIKDSVTMSLLKSIIRNRYDKEITTGNDSILGGDISVSTYKKDDVISLYGVLNENNMKKGIETTLKSLKYLSEYEISFEELNLEKENYLVSLENILKNKDSITNENLIGEINNSFIDDELFLDIEDTVEYYKRSSHTISTKDIKKLAKKIFEDKGAYILLLPEKENLEIKTKNDFKKLITDIKNTKLEKEIYKAPNLTLNKVKLTRGKVSSIKNMKDYKEMTLSNGIEVLYKKTDFKKDEIYISLFKEEGSSVSSSKDYFNSLYASSLIKESGIGNIEAENLNLYMKGKEFSISSNIFSYSQGINLISNKENLEEALNYFTNLVYNPKIDDDIYNVNLNAMKNILKNRKNSSKDVYRDKIIEIVYSNHERKRNITEKDLSLLSKENILNIYKNKFGDFKNYKMVVVGSIDEKDLVTVLEKYYASLPVASNNKTYKSYDIKYPNGIIENEVVKGIDKKIIVSIMYPIKKEYNPKNAYMTDAISRLMRITLIEEIREKLSGVYGISARTNLNKYENSLFTISFSTDPKKEKEVIEAIHKEIDKLIVGDIKQETINSVVENYKLTYEMNQKENSYWIGYLKEKSINNNYKVLNPNDYKLLITKENIKNFSKNFIDKSNYFQVILKPETK